MMTIRLFLSISILLFLSGCFQQIAVKSLGGLMENGFEVLNEEADLQIAEVSIGSNLKLLETILRSDPENEHYLLLASMGYASYSLGFVEDETPERARFFYIRAKEYGLRILTRNRTFRDALEKGIDEFREALTSFGQKDIPPLFWTAMSWGSAISLNLTDPSAIADLPKVEEIMKFVARNNPGYFFGGAHFFLGTLYGSRPQLFGGNPHLSKEHFEECLKMTEGKFLLPFVYYARSYAVQTQNRELFEQCLNTIDSTSIDILPRARLSNAIAKKKSLLLRQKINELF